MKVDDAANRAGQGDEARGAYLPIEAYLPHRGRMVLLDRFLEAEAGRALCAVTIRPDAPFCHAGCVPAYVGIEYMAQTVGALIGWQSRRIGQAIKTGFLVSTRKYASRVDSFPLGATLLVEARENWRDEEGLGVMDCTICHPENEIIAEATLMVFQPRDLNAYMSTL
jgi:predicted hotdog family 3-hydroxylacyl-ACP dehydratase